MKSNFKMALPLIICVLATACNNNKNHEKINTDKSELTEIFPKGEKGSSETFMGMLILQAWLIQIAFTIY